MDEIITEILNIAVRWMNIAARWTRPFVLPFLLIYMLHSLAELTLRAGGGDLSPSDTISRLAGWTIPLLSSSVALGFAVMAIIQLLKPPLRATFHESEIVRWLANNVQRNSPVSTKMNSKEAPVSISMREFFDRLGSTPRDALLELPIEQLAAQIQAASEMALAQDERSDWFIDSLIGESREDIKTSNDKPEEQMRERTRLSYIIQRRLDGLQIQVRFRWRRLLRFLSFTIGLILTSAIAGIFGLWRQNFVGTALLVMLLSALGGFFASVARDAVAIIERLRS